MLLWRLCRGQFCLVSICKSRITVVWVLCFFAMFLLSGDVLFWRQKRYQKSVGDFKTVLVIFSYVSTLPALPLSPPRNLAESPSPLDG
jgi:hypothetical protein